MAWTRWGGRGLWRPIYAVQGASELAVVRPTDLSLINFPDASEEDATAEGNLFTADPNEPSSTQTNTLAAGGAGIFSAAGFNVGSRATLPTRLDLVYFSLKHSVDAHIGVAFSTSASGSPGKNLVNASASARSGIVDATTSGNPFLNVLGAGIPANVRFLFRDNPLANRFEWLTTQPEFRLSITAIPQGFRVMACSVVANTAITVQWGAVWRQIPTP